MLHSNTAFDLKLDSHAERLFFDAVRRSDAPTKLLARFGVQYHFFSLHQIHAFCGIFRLLNATEREVTATIAEVVFEELGEGDSKRIHSVLLENFLSEVGVVCSSLPLERDAVVPGVRDYVDALYSAFWGNDRARALATYCFLENSAIETYPALVALLSECGISKQNLEFFELHSGLEIEHAAAASRLASQLVVSSEDSTRFNHQFSAMNETWNRFWNDITADAAS